MMAYSKVGSRVLTSGMGVVLVVLVQSAATCEQLMRCLRVLISCSLVVYGCVHCLLFATVALYELYTWRLPQLHGGAR